MICISFACVKIIQRIVNISIYKGNNVRTIDPETRSLFTVVSGKHFISDYMKVVFSDRNFFSLVFCDLETGWKGPKDLKY